MEDHSSSLTRSPRVPETASSGGRWATAVLPHEPFLDAARTAGRGVIQQTTISLARRIAGINDLKFGAHPGRVADHRDGAPGACRTVGRTRVRVRDAPQPDAAFDP